MWRYASVGLRIYSVQFSNKRSPVLFKKQPSYVEVTAFALEQS